MHRRDNLRTKLFDCLHHAPEVDAELFIVEGDSAAEAVCAVRDVGFQAVLPIQGKPVNALRASRRRILASPWLTALTAALGNSAGTALPLGDLLYRRVLLLLDPDADGIHTGALLQIFLHQYMRPLFERGQIEIVQANVRNGGTPLVVHDIVNKQFTVDLGNASRTWATTSGSR